MKMSHSFSGRPFSILITSLLLSCSAFAQVNEAPVRYGSGGFAPTDLSGSNSNMRGDDMTGGVVASPLPPASDTNSYQGNVENRLTQLEEQMRNLRGQLEEKDHQIQQLQTQLDKALSDMQMQISSGANGSGASSPQTPPPSSGGNLQSGDMDTSSPPQPNADPNAPASGGSSTVKNLGSMNQSPSGVPIAPSSGDAAGQYDSALNKLKSGDYLTAQGEFDRFLKANPSHQLAANATYWYGETFYAQQKYQDSARIFAESYKKYPKSPKAADSLLKLGMSLGGAGKTKEGCVALKQLKKQFPNGAATKRADSEMAKLSCS